MQIFANLVDTANPKAHFSILVLTESDLSDTLLDLRANDTDTVARYRGDLVLSC